MTKTALELLAPAGTADIGIAAVDHGADAVYIGAPKFSARSSAGAGLEDIARLINHAHLYYARVYVTLNTILTDQELPEALEIIQEVHRLGADGLILQDVGLLELPLPPIPLIASTQMHNSTVEKVKFLEDVGFSRVILARELSIPEIAAIRRETRVELEAFVHGALCVAYSGQCYMSQAITGRSGNRGVCAQPCRSRYTLTDGDGNVLEQNKFFLSLKDLNLISALPELINAGITSFKIEGRYKEAAYVKNVTAAYRLALDGFIDAHPDFRQSSSGKSEFSFSPDPAKTFNRGYTRYFAYGRKEKPASLDTQKAVGECIGTVTNLGKDFFLTDCKDLQNGDGLCFFTKQKDLVGCRVDRVEQGKIYPGSLKDLAVGTCLYRNHDIAFERILKKSSARRKIQITMDLSREANKIQLTVADEDKNRAEGVLSFPFEPARDPEAAKEQLQKQLTSTGATSYQVAGLTLSSVGFVPVGLLNALRRNTLDALTRQRQENFPRKEQPLIPNTVPYPDRSLGYKANVLNSPARKFYERHGAVITEPAFETLPDPVGREVMTTRYCLRHQLDLCPKTRPAGMLPKEPFRIRDEKHTYRLVFDCSACRMKVILEEALAGSSKNRSGK